VLIAATIPDKRIATDPGPEYGAPRDSDSPMLRVVAVNDNAIRAEVCQSASGG
jgi:hypothetical protein